MNKNLLLIDTQIQVYRDKINRSKNPYAIVAYSKRVKVLKTLKQQIC